MGANRTQAFGFMLFTVGFTAITASFSMGGNLLLIVAGAALVGWALAMFRKAKPWEHREE